MKHGKMRSIFITACVLYATSLPLHAADTAPDSPHCRYVALKTIPIIFTDGRLNINAAVNDTPIKGYVDTGMITTTLTRHLVERMGLGLGHAKPIGGIGGESRGYQTRVDKLSIGPIVGKHVTLPVAWELKVEEDLDAIVGADFLFQDDLELSIHDQTLKFMHPLNCGSSTYLAYWSRDASVVGMHQVLPGNAVSPTGDPGQEVIVKINGQEVRAKIDTGAPQTLIDIAAAKRVGITPDSPGVVKLPRMGGGIGNHQQEIWKATFDTFALGNESIPHAKLLVTNLWGAIREDQPGADGSALPEMLLGVDFLKQHRILLAVSQQKAYFTYLGGGVFESEPAISNEQASR